MQTNMPKAFQCVNHEGIISLLLTDVEDHSGKLSTDEVKVIREEILWK